MSDASNPIPPSSPAARRTAPGARWKWPLIILLALAALYLVSPYYSFWRFTEALKAGDQQRFAKTVDFRSVRESLKTQLKARLAEGKPKEPKKEPSLLNLSDQFAPRMIDTLVEAYVTPAGLAALLADVKNLDTRDASGAHDPNAAADPRQPDAIIKSPALHDRLGFDQVRYAFFTGARDFLIDIDGTRLRFRFSKARWVLKSVEPDLGDLHF